MDFISRYNVTWAALTASTLSILTPNQVPSLRTLVIFGEPMGASVRDVWADHVHLMVLYGLSEGAGGNVLQRNVSHNTDHRSLGRGIASNVWLVDMDDSNKLVPIGAVGEIVLESNALARGYVNDPDRNRDVFLSDVSWLPTCKLGGKHSGVLYKTGDLGRFDVDSGCLLYIGRKHVTQIKLHGQFIDLLEIESHLGACIINVPTTVLQQQQSSVVHVTLRGEDTPRIIACIDLGGAVIDDGPSTTMEILSSASVSEFWTATVHQLTAKLSAVIPLYMVPYAFVPVRNMAKTLTGKIDRKKITAVLAELSMVQVQEYVITSQDCQPPTEPIEVVLSELWRTALRHATVPIGRSSNLFELGGDSVTAMRLVGAARSAGLRLSVELIFRHPVLSEQAQASSQLSQGDDVGLDTLTPPPPWSLVDSASRASVMKYMTEELGLIEEQVEDAYPCTAIQESMMAAVSKNPTAYVSRSTFRLPTDTIEEDYYSAWDAVVRANPILRTRIVQIGQKTLQVVVRAEEVSRTTHSSLEKYLDDDVLKSMSFGEPLFRISLIREGEGDGVLLYCVLSLHHAIYDLWSLDLLLDQVTHAYGGAVPEMTPFSPFVRHVGEGGETSREFWNTNLESYDGQPFPRLASPLVVPRPQSSTSIVQLAWKTAHAKNITLSTLARLAWASTISSFSGTRDVAFGAVVTGRGSDVAGIERMTGPTVSTVPLRLTLQSSERTVRETAEDIQNASLAMIPHEQLGLSEIRKLNPGASQACRFQSVLVVQAREKPHGTDTLHRRHGDGSDRFRAFVSHAVTVICEQSSADLIQTRILFDEDIIDSTRAAHYLDLFLQNLSVMAAQPEQRLSHIPTITSTDLDTLKSWNGNLPKAIDRRLEDLIAEQTSRGPHVEAISAWDGCLTYEELQHESGRLARRLRCEHGVSRGHVVPIIMTKSKHVPIAMLAVIRTRAAFTLLDPSLPVPRLQLLLGIVEPKILLHNGVKAVSQLRMNDITMIHIEEDENEYDEMTPAPEVATSTDCVYVAWTSGSTGIPKAVLTSHASYATATMPYAHDARITAGSRVLQFASHSFDVSPHPTNNPLHASI